VTWQGRLAQPNPKQQVAIILQLKSGGKETTFSASTDTSGYFTVTVGAVTDSIYQWRVRDADSPSRRSTYLARSGSTKLQAAAVNKVELGTLKAGDTNGDNVVNMADFVTVRRSFGPCTARGCVDPRADLNGDSTINVTDFNLVKSNFGQAGAPPF
jgi:hypothetical protein